MDRTHYTYTDTHKAKTKHAFTNLSCGGSERENDKLLVKKGKITQHLAVPILVTHKNKNNKKINERKKIKKLVLDTH